MADLALRRTSRGSPFLEVRRAMKAPNLGSAWRYRHFILGSIRAEFHARFARSRLGGAWMVVHPLVQAAIFALVLAEVIGARLPGMGNDRFAYSLYLLSGILAWSLFADVVTRCLTLFIDNAALMKKMMFPRICLAIITAGSALVNNFLLFLAVLLLFALLGHRPGAQTAWVPALMLVTLSLGVGIGLTLGVVNVFVRDVGQVVPVVLQFGFWLAPITYTTEIVPASLRPFLDLNPMTWVVRAYHDAMLYDRPPDLVVLGLLVLAAIAALSVALLLFRRASAEMVDVL
jgi:lipopolysaccharide transport system permease protein